MHHESITITFLCAFPYVHNYVWNCILLQYISMILVSISIIYNFSWPLHLITFTNTLFFRPFIFYLDLQMTRYYNSKLLVIQAMTVCYTSIEWDQFSIQSIQFSIQLSSSIYKKKTYQELCQFLLWPSLATLCS